jgi:hemerythrin superfamily protein
MATKTAKKAATLTVTELLHEDHLKVKDLFFQFTETESSDVKEQLVRQILTELFIHATVEEEIVYPAVEEEADDAEDLIDEAETEHHVVKVLMAELSKMTSQDDQFEAKVTVLCELVSHHIREEEKEMFQKLRESDADLEELAEQVQQRKQSLIGKPLPEMNVTLSIGSPNTESSVRKVVTKNGKTTQKKSA